jgi:membrane dipeptidase
MAERSIGAHGSRTQLPTFRARGKRRRRRNGVRTLSPAPNLEMLDRFCKLGARYVGLAHDGDNGLARSAPQRRGDPAEPDTGVSALGAEAIARMNVLGIMVDVSHGSKQTALDAMRLSAAPVIASHSGIASVNAHPRNLDDETLQALKADGGVVQVVAYDSYLKRQPEQKAERVRALRPPSS